MNRGGLRRFFLALFCLAMAAAAALPQVDRTGDRYLNESLTQALTVFAVARTLNGVISVLQGTEIAVQPVGIGVTLTPGEILDPVNDLIERFSWVMLAASASLGLQQLVGTMVAHEAVRLVASGLFLLAGALLLWPGVRDTPWVRRAWPLLLMVALMRFLVPGYLVLTAAVSDAFLAATRDQAAAELRGAQQMMENERNQWETLQPPAEAAPDAGWWSGWERWLGDARGQFDLSASFARLQGAADRMIQEIVQLIAVFALQTVLLPLGFLYLLLRIGRATGRALAGTGPASPAPRGVG